jgi:hypothetical protein
MYMRDTMHQIDSGIIVSFLKAIMRKFQECLEIPLNIAGAAAKKMTNRLRMLLAKDKTASGHLVHGSHACLVPVNYATTNVFKQLQEKQKAARNTRSCDYRHLLLLLPFILSNLFRQEVDEHNSHHRGAPVVDPSEELIPVTNVLLCWHQRTGGLHCCALRALRALLCTFFGRSMHGLKNEFSKRWNRIMQRNVRCMAAGQGGGDDAGLG